MGERLLRFDARVVVDATAEALWPHLADTARINRIAGLPPIHYRLAPRLQGGSSLSAEFHLGPLTLARWDEDPFQWEVPRFYSVERRYHSGPIVTFNGGVDLTPKGSGTEVRFWSDFLPRNLLGRLLIQYVVGPRSVAAGTRQAVLIGRYLQGHINHPYPQLRRGGSNPVASPPSFPAPPKHPPTAPLAQEHGGRWAQLARECGSPGLVARLRDHLLQAPDDEVVKMRPFALADRWGENRHETLTLFLRATTAGVVEMSWDVLCPHCRGAKAEYASLGALASDAYCDTCNVHYEAVFDRNVEVRLPWHPPFVGRRQHRSAWAVL